TIYFSLLALSLSLPFFIDNNSNINELSQPRKIIKRRKKKRIYFCKKIKIFSCAILIIVQERIVKKSFKIFQITLAK
ncbi:MAG: hypothetical protein K2H53_01210, partial [Clostridia bacterium]|nr:hypothetical protein [Clostridia bacterium]